MKKLLIAGAIAASLATGASAQQNYEISSHVTGAQLWFNGIDLLALPTGFYSSLEFGGFANDATGSSPLTSQVTFHGSTTFDAGTAIIRLTFELSQGSNVVGGSNPGVTFNGGEVQIDYWTGTGWLPYSTVPASGGIPFVAGIATTSPPVSGTSTGLILSNATLASPLPGLYDGTPGSEDRAVSGITLLGSPSALFLQGSITLTPN